MREVQELYEDALIIIEDKFIKPDDPIKPKKEITTINVSKFNNKAHLDTEKDVNVFIERVRSELLEAIKGNFRVRIQ